MLIISIYLYLLFFPFGIRFLHLLIFSFIVMCINCNVFSLPSTVPRKDPRFPRDRHGRIFLDRNPDIFMHCLEFLRSNFEPQFEADNWKANIYQNELETYRLVFVFYSHLFFFISLLLLFFIHSSEQQSTSF